MQIRRKLPILPRDLVRVYPEGTPEPFIIDRRFLRKVRKVRWRYIADKKRARGYFGRGEIRLYLHRYILSLAKKYYPEVTFANGDPFDCRLTNLTPYRRYEEGANRSLFKNNTSKRKGVSFHKTKKLWISMIRTRGKLRHLGYFETADQAANAYAAAWNLAHPDLPPQPITSR